MIKFDKVNTLLEENNLDALLIMSDYNRRYLSNFTGSSGALVITKENRYLISDFRYDAQARAQAEGFEFILQDKGLLDFTVEFIKGKNLRTLGFEGHHINYNTSEKLAENFEIVPLTNEIEKIRMFKTQEEVSIIKKACEIADETYDHILKYIKPGMSELNVRNEVENHMRKLGAEGSSFDIIVASGYRGALPHGVASDKIIEAGEMITLDFGAYYNGYASDITRSFGVGHVSEEMEKVHNIVLESQLAALDEIKTGMTGREADSVARDIITKHGYGDNFGHSLGHGFGLEVHEMPSLAKSSETVLEKDMCVTVEPGIYIEDVGGVRIEDDCLVTDQGLEKLSHSSKELFII
ncbi:aminopeptidase P family protein [Salinicoccus jeotgali]|uniref:Aminopeptidase P family protein n=1 Tax=Salinicoccus jeotgali TaxID=381634 RepID=A0ABP7EUK9_9STAP